MSGLPAPSQALASEHRELPEALHRTEARRGRRAEMTRNRSPGRRLGFSGFAALLVMSMAVPLSACASLKGVMVPVSGGTVPGASRVDMLVATTRKRTDPVELFSGDRGPSATF